MTHATDEPQNLEIATVSFHPKGKESGGKDKAKAQKSSSATTKKSKKDRSKSKSADKTASSIPGSQASKVKKAPLAMAASAKAPLAKASSAKAPLT